jgi:hypothetical protein
MKNTTKEPSQQAAPKRRSTSDHIFTAFHHACDQGELEVADQLLRVIEAMSIRGQLSAERRDYGVNMIVAAYERLWNLRHSASKD